MQEAQHKSSYFTIIATVRCVGMDKALLSASWLGALHMSQESSHILILQMFKDTQLVSDR